jgi:predicted DNA-binding protein with PD1-like motif
MTDITIHGIRLEEGLELRSAVLEYAVKLELSFCDIAGFGELEWVELAGDAEGETTFLEGPFQLIDLNGRVRLAGDTSLLDLFCTLSRHTDNGIQLLGGKLQRAKTVFTELRLVPLTLGLGVSADISKPARPNPPKLVPDSSRPDHPIESLTPPPPTAASTPGADNRWAKAIAESDRVQKQAHKDTRSDLIPSRGDIVKHLQFGRCTVVRVGDDHITLRKPDNRNVQLGIAILDFTFVDKEDKKSVFNVKVVRK